MLVAVLALAGPASACLCVNEPIEDRLDRADVAFVGRVVSEAFSDSVKGGPRRVLGVEVEQRVKGDPGPLSGPNGNKLFVRSPYRTSCDLSIERDRSVGLLLTRLPSGALFGDACSTASPGELVVAGGEPRGGVIKVVIGIAILGLVLLWSFRRLRKESRPDLPGAPRP